MTNIIDTLAKIEYNRWLSSRHLDSSTRGELLGIDNDEAAISDRFCGHLSFGTGGLRGIMGAGTNRMNILTVRRATMGLADYIVAGRGKSACIAYDTRMDSKEFAEYAAEVLCAAGITVYMFTGTRPTPLLSFAVREKKAFAGIVITASHNPREYNGYKVYGADGGQITDDVAYEISYCIEKHDVLAAAPRMDANDARERGLLFDLDDIDELYYDKVVSLTMRRDMIKQHSKELRILYTPLHGAGNTPVRRVLSSLGYEDLSIVPEQELPDGAFPTVPCPNPEDPGVFALALKQVEKQPVDIILATDPDCDRVAVMAPDGNGYSMLTGNQIGCLLCEYIISAKKESGSLAENSTVVKTIVTSDLAREICGYHGVALVETLTGFKYIGEKIGEWEDGKEHTFLFGFEESCGYLAGDFVRDKDAVIAAALICEMALHYKLKGLTLHEALVSLFSRYGFFSERLISITLEGSEGDGKISAIMDSLRSKTATALFGNEAAETVDYMNGETGLPRSDAVKFRFKDSGWLAVRPSGTEPKVKFYFGASGKDPLKAGARLKRIEEIVYQLSTSLT